MIQVTFSIPLMPLAVFAIYHESTTILIYLCSFLLHWTSKLANKQTILQINIFINIFTNIFINIFINLFHNLSKSALPLQVAYKPRLIGISTEITKSQL